MLAMLDTAASCFQGFSYSLEVEPFLAKLSF